MNKNNIMNAFNFRHACKEFDLNKKISDENFNLILETGRLSPSSFGLEPWKFLIVQNSELREKLKKFTWGGIKQLPTASHIVVILTRKAKSLKPNSNYISNFAHSVQKMSDKNILIKINHLKQFQKVDFNLNNDKAIFDWACRQTYIALANMMITSAMLGIDSCPMEGFNVNKIDQALKNDFKIDTDEFGISCMIAFGYRVREPKPKTRQSIEKITKWFK